jgi:Icc-related predicted phosphoesterase
MSVKRKHSESEIFNIDSSNEEINKKINKNINKIIIDFEKKLLEYLLSDEVDNYINFDKIEEELHDNNNNIQEIVRHNIEERKNRCIECNIDIGQCNPRQLCCKTYCPNILNKSYTLTIQCSVCKFKSENNYNLFEIFDNDISICRNCLIEKSCIP